MVDLKHDLTGKVINPNGLIYYIQCPSTRYMTWLGCPVPICELGYEPFPYYCKYIKKNLDTLTANKYQGSEVGMYIELDKTFRFELGLTANVSIIDSSNKKSV
jgi:hypothetical protein